MTSHVDFVRRVYRDGLIDHHIGQVLERCHPDVELVNPDDAVEVGARRGRDALRAVATTGWEPFAAHEHELQRLFADEDVVVAAVTFRARGLGSGIVVEQDEVHSWTFREGQVIRFAWGRDLVAALVAAGLSEAAEC